MARKTNHISILQADGHAISMLRCRVAGKKPVDLVWARQAGVWQTPESLSEAFVNFVREKRIADDDVYLILPRYEVTTRFLTLPSHDLNEIAGMVRFSAEEYVPYSLDELIIDQCVLNPMDSGESHVLAALAHHETVDKQIALFKSAGLSPQKVFLSTACLTATARACSSEGPFAVINLTPGGVEITVFEKGLPVFSRGIVTTQDWEEICRNPDAGGGAGVLDTSGAEELAAELRGSLSAYRRESSEGLGADEVYVACAYADVTALCASLSERTGKNCRPAAYALSALDTTNANLPGIPIDYIGALIEITENVPATPDLLPRSETEARRLEGAKRLALRAAFFAVLILAGLAGLFYQAVYQKTGIIRELESRIAAIEPNARGITEKREALSILSRQVDRTGSIIEQLARLVDSAPDGRVNFVRLSLRRGEGVVLWGRAKTVSDVAQFAQNIRSRADQHLTFFAQARSLYENQTMERNESVFSYQIDVPVVEDEDAL